MHSAVHGLTKAARSCSSSMRPVTALVTAPLGAMARTSGMGERLTS